MHTILIVDDERHVARVLRVALERAGYRVETANNGEEGLRKLIELKPDALVTDIMMPKMTGRELVLTITREFPERDFPILVMTASLESEHREWVDGISNLHFVEKPVSPRHLIEILAGCFTVSEQDGPDRAAV